MRVRVPTIMKAGFIGLGGMGKPVARCILRAGYDLTVTDLREEPVQELAAEGANTAESVEAAADGADIVLASLNTNRASAEVGARVLSTAKAGAVYVDLSTITPSVIQRIAEEGENKGIHVVDAPVSGSIQQREEGKLAVMAGGTAEAFLKARPVLQTFGGAIHHVGPSGAGATIKLINNLTMATNAIAAMEALVLGIKAGLDPEVVRDVIGASSGNSGVFRMLSERVFSETSVPEESGPRQGMRLVVKDTQLAVDFAREMSVPLFGGGATAQAFVAAQARGLSDREWWALIEVYEELAGIRVRPPNL